MCDFLIVPVAVLPMKKMKAERGSHFLILEKSVSVTRKITCHILAMVQFKQSSISHPKTSSWKPEGENSSCCSWEGVECDEETGHIIGLHLSSSCLYGSANSSNCLFRRVHLQKSWTSLIITSITPKFLLP